MACILGTRPRLPSNNLLCRDINIISSPFVGSYKVLSLPVDVETGLDTMGCDDDGPESSGNLMTGLECDIESSSKAVMSGPLVARKIRKRFDNLITRQ